MKHNQHIADLGPLLAKQGIRHVIICPGSRNAPLIQLFTGNPDFQCHSVVDERSAGYLALGMARQLQEPVGVVTTSGTAVLNLAPAVAEAFFQRLPLVVLTADRPRETIPQFNNQIIDQTRPFAGNSGGFYQLPEEVRDEADLQEMLEAVETLMKAACGTPRGPVHFNIPLAEPLYESLPVPLFSHFGFPVQEIQKEEDAALDKLSAGTRILLLAGMGPPDAGVQAILEAITRKHRAVVVAENIANMPSDRFIAHPELMLNAVGDEELKGLAPDLVVVFGGQVVSKRLKLFLDAYPPQEIRILEKDPETELQKILDAGENIFNDYLETWKAAEEKALANAADFLGEAPFGNLSVIHRTLLSVPGHAVLHLGNSSIIRYSQLLPVRNNLRCYSNRGTSGIDGTVSAAVGAAMVSRELHLLVVGDLAFVYDSSALWNKDFPENLRIVLVNDGGGGIFRLLDGPDRMPFFEEYSVTHHPVSPELLSRSFGRGFQNAADLDELEEKLELLLRPGSGMTVLEADTSGSENSRIFKAFLNHLQS